MGMAGEPRSLRLLIIEDCEADALLVLRELRRGGFEVTHSRVDTEDGLREALRQPWDVILSDYAMPCLSGQIALSVVRELAPLTPFVVLSGSIGEEAAVALLSAGASDYLLKDRTSRLCSAIDRALREADGLRRRREAEEALRRSEERFRTLVESMSESVFTTGLDARIDGVFGNWPADLVPARQAHRCQTVGELLGAEVVPRHEAAMRQAERGEQAIYECSLETAQGSRSLSVSLSPRRNERGEIAGFVGVGRDVTVQKHLESQLAVSDRLASLGMLASGVAHEINNPVSAVIINAEVLLDALLAPQGAQNHHDSIEIATMIRDAGERIAGVVKDLKLFSRAPDDRLSALDVRRVIDSSVRLVGNVHRSVARVAARYEDVAPVLGNEARLGQVFLNLISNAIESFLSHDRKNEVRIVCRRRGLDRLAIEVIDNGAGMPPDVVKQLFTPFFTTKEVGGTGLGLAICHRIITSHGGSIEVESTPGQGSIFRVLLPLAVPLAAPVERPQRREASGRRVLVVDDDRLVLESICRALHREHDTIGVTHAREALELIQSGEHFDLIVCDLAMPGGSGVDLHDQLRRLAPGLAEGMIFISGGGFHPEVDAFFSRTSNERIDKPFSPAALADLISRRLRAAESTDV
jgi:signal transduction histidine kinase